MQVLWDKNEECHLRNEASLNFVSLRSHLDSVGRRGRQIVFSVDSADAFIDGGCLKLYTGGVDRRNATGTPGLGARRDAYRRDGWNQRCSEPSGWLPVDHRMQHANTKTKTGTTRKGDVMSIFVTTAPTRA